MHRILLIAASFALSAAAVAAPGQPGTDGPASATLLERMPIETLQATYLACDAHSRMHRMDPATAEHCMRVADALRQRAFGDDLERLLAWWRTQRQAALAEAR